MRTTVLLALPAIVAVVDARMHVRRTGSHHRLAARQSSGDAGSATVAAAWFEGWSTNFTSAMVPWDKYTHVTYSFAIPQDDGKLDLSLSGGETGLKTFVAAAKNASVKALVSVGGWTGSINFSPAVGSAENRTAFVKEVTSLISTYQLDGVDFDWEYPVLGGQECNLRNPEDTANFLSFLKELRQTSEAKDLVLTAAAGLTPWKDNAGTPSKDVSEFAKLLDYVAIMNYDQFGQWSDTVGPNAALNDSCAPAAAQQGSAVSAVAAWTAAGIPANQLVLGVASYGHAFNVSSANAFAPAPTPSADNSDADCEEIALFPAFDKWTYAAGEEQATECGVPIAKDVQYTFAGLVAAGMLDTSTGNATEGVDYRFDECSQTPFLYDESTSTLVAFDDAASFAAKGEFIKAEGLKGFAVWEASGDFEDILLDSIRGAAGFKTVAAPQVLIGGGEDDEEECEE